MTDRTEPPFDGPTLEDDATSRIPTRDDPAQGPAATEADAAAASRPIAPMSPLTPASRASAPPPAFEHEMPWATPAPATPVLAPRPARRRGRLRWAISLIVIAL